LIADLSLGHPSGAAADDAMNDFQFLAVGGGAGAC
jgi:hypothetical protein